MAYDFPANPTTGMAANGYTFDGVAWINGPAGGGGGGGGTGVTDGDKGDIVVSTAGALWMLDDTVVTPAAKTVLDDATISAMRVTLGVEPTTITVSDTPPSAPVNDQIWWESDTGVLAVRFGGAWVQVNAPASSGIPEAPTDGRTYMRRGSTGVWVASTISLSGPTGGQDGDVWYKVSA